MNNYSYLIAMTIFSLLFSGMLFSLGLSMIKIDSMEKELAAYRADKSNGTLFEKYFLGFAVFDGKIAEWTIKNFGDKPWTVWMKISGGIFILFGVLFLVGIVGLWYLNLTSR